MRDPFPIPDSHISVLIIESVQGQIKLVGRAQQIFVGIYKDRCSKFHRLIFGAIMRIYCDASSKEISLAPRSTCFN